MLKNLRDYFLIRKSGYFDPRFYLLKNPDIRKADVTPLMHYVRHGWKEGRYPSSEWKAIITSGKVQVDPGSSENPLIEYIRQTRTDKRPARLELIKTIQFIYRFAFPFWLKKGMVFYGGYPYPEREVDGYYQRIRAIDSLFTRRWRIYIDSVPLAGRDSWYDIPESQVLVLRQHGKGIQRLFIEFWIRSCILYSRMVYLQSVLSASGKEFFWGNPRIKKVIDVHGAVPEEFKYQGDEANSQHFSQVEKYVLPRADYIVVVSEAMRTHLVNKYMGQIPGKFIILPNIQDFKLENVGKPYVNGKPVLIYAGGVQVWQQIPKIVNAIIRTYHQYQFKLYCPYPEAISALLPPDKRDGNNLELASKSRVEIFKEYQKAHYGFILRENRVVNRVSCPTKLVEYLAMGVVPIVDTPEIGDFKAFGMRYISLQDVLKNKLPSETDRQKMAEQNYAVYMQILYQYKSGVMQLQQLFTPGGMNHR